jgi:folylpolyglutamate synthase
MTESIVRYHGFKTGLFTSPHLVTVRERIKIDGKAISEEQFVKHFWLCWDKLQASRSEKWPMMPGWFRYLNLLAFKIFQEECVDCAVVEVGMGGKGDSTNILTFPAACGITLLDYDHTEVLGNTLSEIAGAKAGIFKTGVPAVTVPQTEEALGTLLENAVSTKNPLLLADPTLEAFSNLSTSSTIAMNDPSLGLKAPFLKTNAVLAVALSELWFLKWHPSHATYIPSIITEHSTNHRIEAIQTTTNQISRYPPHILHPSTIDGLQKYHWPGRAQIHQIPDSPIRLFLDGAHTTESVKACVDWFSAHSRKPSEASHVLFFNCNKPRDPRVLLAPIVAAIASGAINVDFLYFTMSQVAPQFRKDPSNDIAYTANTQTTWQQEMAGMWTEMVIQTKNSVNSKLGENSLSGSSASTTPPSVMDDFAVENDTKLMANGKLVVWPVVKVVINVNEALEDISGWVNELELGPSQVDILATGSLYLVGAMLEYLDYPTDL